MKTIELTVDAKGNSKIITKGFSGGACKEASKVLEKALGLVESDKPTGEAYNVENVTLKQNS